jgi:hypothetical protein
VGLGVGRIAQSQFGTVSEFHAVPISQRSLSAVRSHETPNVARHVCIVSRQERDLRNLSPEFMLTLLGRSAHL